MDESSVSVRSAMENPPSRGHASLYAPCLPVWPTGILRRRSLPTSPVWRLRTLKQRSPSLRPPPKRTCLLQPFLIFDEDQAGRRSAVAPGGHGTLQSILIIPTTAAMV